MASYLYIFRGGQADWASRSPAEMQATMQKWGACIQELSKSGNLKDAGQPLEPGGRLVSGKKKSITDGPYAEAKDLVGGYMLVSANTIEQACELSKGCPIFEVDGNVEVRPIREGMM